MELQTAHSAGDTSGQSQRERGAGLDRASAVVMAVMAFLLPVLFLPTSLFTFQTTKGLVLTLGVVTVLVLWLLARLKGGDIEIPKNGLFVAALALPLIYLISALFSSAPTVSLVGQGFEISTFSSILALFLLLFASALVFKNRKRATYVYTGFFIALALVALFQLLRLIFGPGFLDLGIFTSTVSNLVGKWNDLGLFFGLGVILSLSALELLRLSKPMRIFMYSALIVSLFFSAVVNFTASWILIGIIALLFMIYSLSIGRYQPRTEGEEGVQTSARSVVVFIISLIFVLAGGPIGDLTSNVFNISQIEARPSWQATIEIARETIQQDPVLGAGPNRFSNEWLANKPDGINQTIFWNTDFNQGIGIIPSTLVSVGLLGFLAWIVFLVLFVVVGLKTLSQSVGGESYTSFLSVSSFLAALYLWVFSIIYVPNMVMFALAFLFSGLFLAVQFQAGYISTLRFSPSRNPKVGFVTVFATVVLLIGVVSWGYVLAVRYASAAYFQSGIFSFNATNNLDKAEGNIVQAIRLAETDRYYRTLSQLSIVRLNQVIGQQDLMEDELRARFQAVLGQAVDSARRATQLDPTHYQNWLSLGAVYEAIVPLGVDGAYENAVQAYERALEENPRSPVILLTRARLEVARGDNDVARVFVRQAINLKNNYTEAVFLLSQIEASEGNTQAAINSVESASLLSPNDPTIYFQLGLLRYNDEDYRGSVSALERAVRLSPTYSNAKYFLGLAYEQLGRQDEAVGQFEDLQILNPNNQEVTLILENLRSGRDPFSGAEPPIDDEPESREELPIEEEEGAQI